MKKQVLITLLLGIATIAQAQNSIKVEQSGDFIKIGYQILDSSPGEIYRIRVLCSINGGLNTEIKSVSGDTGDNVQGGKPEYFVLWDVLRDVDQLSSAEFIVRAELIKDINRGPVSGKDIGITAKWAKKLIHVGPAIELPGPKPGFMAGVMGSFGVAISMHYGNYATDGDQSIDIGEVSLDDFLNDKKVIPSSYFLTKRISNYNAFQMHLLAGVKRTRLIFKDPNASQNPYREEKLYGPALGITADYKMASFNFQFSHVDPGPIEKEDDSRAISPLSYLTFSLGLRF
jgi:hypothetical protein